jgi:Zn-dependent protease with chaperone function
MSADASGPTIASMLVFLDRDIEGWRRILEGWDYAHGAPHPSLYQRLAMLRAIADKLREQQGVTNV